MENNETVEKNPVEQTTEQPKTQIIKQEKLAQELGLVMPKNMGDVVSNTMSKYIERGLTLPEDYNVENAVISSFLRIKQDEKLMACTQESIAQALIDMATMGLNATKSQCYFVPYSGKVQLQPSYFGKITAIKRINGVIDVKADVIYKGTEYELEADSFGNDSIKILKVCPLEERNFDNIIASWCKIVLDEEVWGTKEFTTIMTLEQIKSAWNQGSMKGNSPAHKNFKDEMCKKTVINRACKNFVNSAKDNDMLIETINRVTENDYSNGEIDYSINVPKQTKVIDI